MSIHAPRHLFGLVRNHALSRTRAHPYDNLHRPIHERAYWHTNLPASPSARHLFLATQRTSTSYMPRAYRGLHTRRQLRCTRLRALASDFQRATRRVTRRIDHKLTLEMVPSVLHKSTNKPDGRVLAGDVV